MTFTGQSYARWRLTDTNERRFSLQLSLKTMQASKAMLMYAVGRVDHSILEVGQALLFVIGISLWCQRLLDSINRISGHWLIFLM